MSDRESGRSLAVSVVGWVTLLFAVGYAVAAGALLFIGVAIVTADELAKPTGWEFLGWILAAIVAVVGVLFAIQAGLTVPAGLGVILRRGWGRILTFIVASLAMLWGAAFIAVTTADSLYLALGLAQIAYGLFAILVLATNGDEFREHAERRRGRGRSEGDRHAEPAFADEPR